MLQNYIIMALKHVQAYLIEVAFDTKCKDRGYQRKTMQWSRWHSIRSVKTEATREKLCSHNTYCIRYIIMAAHVC